MAAETVEISDLAQAMDLLVFRHSTDRRHIVQRFRIEDAPAFAELVDLQDDAGMHSIVKNKHNMKRLARADSILALLDIALLPALEVFPTEPVAVNTLPLYDGKLHYHANVVGGSFRAKYHDLHEGFRRYIDDAFALPCNVTVAELRSHIDGFIPMVNVLREGEFTIAQVDKR